MTARLQTAPPEVASLIEGLPEPLILVDLDYRILAANEPYRELYAPDENIVGRRCYEVSHRYTAPCDEASTSCLCPRREALVSGRSARVLHVHHTPRGEEHVKVQLSPIKDARGKVSLFIERLRSLPMARDSAAAQGMVGKGPAFLHMLDLISRVAATDTTALLLGETGTGKEMVAQAIHDSSQRREGPFVVVDCSGLTETLFENELFGHEKGAFTGAAAPKIGLVEAAKGGTLFLDEIGDIPLGEQVKLLRLIETGTFRRVGGVQALRTDIRLVAATHRDLEQMIEDGSFRRDLYYRISAFPIHLPALRERREDIPRLARTLLARIQPDRTMTLSAGAMRALVHYGYPGNVRELRNILERASLLAEGDAIHREHLPRHVLDAEKAPPETGAPGCRPTSGSALRAAERDALRQALARHQGSRRSLAQEMGISERTLYRKLHAHGLSGAGPAAKGGSGVRRRSAPNQ